MALHEHRWGFWGNAAPIGTGRWCFECGEVQPVREKHLIAGTGARCQDDECRCGS